MASAFISHSSKDDRYVTELEQFLRSLGFTQIFNDGHTIEPDARFREQIEQGIRECDTFVVVLSHDSVKSNWVDYEVRFARERGTPVTPVRIDDCTLPESFEGHDVIDLRKEGGRKLRLSPPRFLHHSAEFFLGREPDLALLDSAWADDTNVLSIIAWGGVGKTALLSEWIQTRFIDRQWLDRGGRLGLLAYLDWSFYDQGTRATTDMTAPRTGSVGDFFDQALAFFGDDQPSLPGKASRLAGLVRNQRTLLILDGLEPLQYPVGHQQAGRIHDPDLRDLIYALAQDNPGLCLVTSRQALTDLNGFHGRGARRQDLDELPRTAAVRLLRKLQINGTDQELEDACDQFGCHALSLTLLGRFLFDAHAGDIRRIDRIRDLKRADRLTREDRHRTAWKVLEAYEAWLSQSAGGGDPRALAVLRLSGLFDRTATAECLSALREPPAIVGLTAALQGMGDDEWNVLLHRLERAHLVKLRTEPPADRPSRMENAPALDVHPLIRDYFAHQLRKQHPDGFRAAHSRLFDHLCASTSHRPDTLPGLQPLYQAVTHGCLAGRHQEACHKVYVDRILRGTRGKGYYSVRRLGAFGTDLGAVAAFFDEPWSRPTSNLTEPDQAWMLSLAASYLRALGRLTEAVEPMRAALKSAVESKDWRNAAIRAGILSETEVILGQLEEAVDDGRRAIEFAGRSGAPFLKMAKRTTAADALHQSGEREEALGLFAEAERMQKERQPEYPLLYSVQGFRNVDLLLDPAERAAWRFGVTASGGQRGAASANPLRGGKSDSEAFAACAEAERRSSQTLRWAKSANASLLTIALDLLTLARAALYRALLHQPGEDGSALPRADASSSAEDLGSRVDTALASLRDSNNLDDLPKALLTAALYHATLGGDPDQARWLLDEAQLIAERGPMPLFLADVHLHRARLFPDRIELARARELIEEHGYWRRREELADAESASVEWSPGETPRPDRGRA